MTRPIRMVLTLVAVAAAGAAGFWVGRHGLTVPTHLTATVRAWTGLASAPPPAARPAPAGPVIYYRDPDGRPFYSAEPRTTPDGRDWQPVHASEDITFDSPPAAEATPGPAAPAQTSGRRVLYYRNPMGLPDISPVPKRDSMGMDYIPVYEGEENDGGTVRIAPGRLQRIGVRSEPAAREVLVTPIQAPGSVQLDERRQSVVSLRFEAWLERVSDVTTGSFVRRGQPLFQVYGPALSGIAAEYTAALSSRMGEPSSNVAGARRRLLNLGVPEAVVADIERRREAPLTVMWPAPRNGIVLERNAVDGQRAMPGDVLFRLADISVVWVLADVPERDLPMLTVGQAATVRPRGYPGQVLSGTVALIYPMINRVTRTARIRIELANPAGLLRPDMYVDVGIADAGAETAVTVPDSAVIDSGNRQLVILDRGDGRFEPRPVRLGRRGNGRVEIREGIADGDQVVTSANFLIDAESNLRAALQSLQAPEQPR